MGHFFYDTIANMKKRPYRRIDPGTTLLVRQIIVGLLILSFFGLLISTVWFSTRISSLTINQIDVTGGETIPHSQLEGSVWKTLDGSYLGIVPRVFAFTYPHEEILESLKQIERVKNINLVRSGGNTLHVEFEEYVPYALWCTEEENPKCMFLDDNGYAFAVAPSLTGGSFVRFVSIARDPIEHTQAFDEISYRKVHELVDLLETSGWYVSKAEIDGAGDAYFTIVGGGEFKVSLIQDPKETVNNLLTVLQSDAFAHIKPGNFEYIDLRFGSKVFVNEETIQPGSTASSTEEGTGETPVEPNKPIPETVPPVIAEEPTATTVSATDEE